MPCPFHQWSLKFPWDRNMDIWSVLQKDANQGTTLEKRTRLLPVVITTKSFTENGWIEQWLEIRHKAKLDTGPDTPLLPNPASGGGWTKIPVSCEVAGDWLRALLKDVPGPNKGVRIATHSCKSSILSMCAKYGVEPAARKVAWIPHCWTRQINDHIQQRCDGLACQVNGTDD